jgi:hypothetical protein
MLTFPISFSIPDNSLNIGQRCLHFSQIYGFSVVNNMNQGSLDYQTNLEKLACDKIFKLFFKSLTNYS